MWEKVIGTKCGVDSFGWWSEKMSCPYGVSFSELVEIYCEWF